MPPLVLFQTQRFLARCTAVLPAREQLAHVAPVHADEGDGAVAAVAAAWPSDAAAGRR